MRPFLNQKIRDFVLNDLYYSHFELLYWTLEGKSGNRVQIDDVEKIDDEINDFIESRGIWGEDFKSLSYEPLKNKWFLSFDDAFYEGMADKCNKHYNTKLIMPCDIKREINYLVKNYYLKVSMPNKNAISFTGRGKNYCITSKTFLDAFYVKVLIVTGIASFILAFLMLLKSF